MVALLIITAGTVALVLQSNQDAANEARNRSLDVTEAFVNTPGIPTVLKAHDPTPLLEPRAEAARKLAHVDFLIVTNSQGIVLAHPDPSRIGTKLVGDIGTALAGHDVVEVVDGPIDPVVHAIIPIRDPNGTIIGLASGGMEISEVRDTIGRQLPLLFAATIAGLGLAVAGIAHGSRKLSRQTHGLGPGEMTRMYEHHNAVLHSVREGVLIVTDDHKLVLANDEARQLLTLPPSAEGQQVSDLGLDPQLTDLLVSGRITSDELITSGDRLLAVNNRHTEAHGGPPGTVATLRDTTDFHTVSNKAEAARKRLKLLYDAKVEVGTTLDVSRTAQELALTSIPRLADFVTVDLADTVLSGEEPHGSAGMPLRRVAVHGIHDRVPLYSAGEAIAYSSSTPQARVWESGRVILTPDLRTAPGWQAQDPERMQGILDSGVHSLITVPLRARGTLLGIVNFLRSERPEPFEDDDVSLAEELAGHAAVCIDNARRYTREHSMAVTLQESLLPHGLPDQNALDVAYRYLPAHGEVSGDWFDVIPLPGARVALVVGDVVGHGLHATATMGRLRTAIHNFSSLDMPPDELLSRLDELVSHIDRVDTAIGGGAPITGATCLYVIYDPVDGQCVMARAGHVPPAVVRPDGTVEVVELPAGPPLGLSAMPFEAETLQLPEGSRLVLYTDGLLTHRERDMDAGLTLLRHGLARDGRTTEDTCQTLVDMLKPPEQDDDIVLLVARTRMLDRDRIADWDVPSDPRAVADVRSAVVRKLEEWGVSDEAFTTELILSELLTNAIRYAAEPIHVRLLLDQNLICEVSDASSTAPHLRYAATMDEGGRGLFLVAQFADRWGTRYTETGKVIWSAQAVRRDG